MSNFKSYIFLNYFIINSEISDYFEEKIIAMKAMATIKVLLFIISDAESPGFSVGFSVEFSVGFPVGFSVGFVAVGAGVAVVVILGKLLHSESVSPYKIKNDCLEN